MIGSGPARVFAGWLLTMQGYRPLLIERGKSVRERSRDIRQFEAVAVETGRATICSVKVELDPLVTGN